MSEKEFIQKTVDDIIKTANRYKTHPDQTARIYGLLMDIVLELGPRLVKIREMEKHE